MSPKNIVEFKKRNDLESGIYGNIIDLSYSNLSNSELFDFASFTDKEELHLNDNYTLADDVSGFFQNFKQMKFLNISQTHITEKSFKPTYVFNHLELLIVGWRCYPHPDDVSDLPVFSDAFLDNLNAPFLRELIIHRNCTITDEGLMKLIKFPHLESITLHSPFITEDGINKLIDEIPNKKIRYRIADQEEPYLKSPQEEISYKIEIDFE